MAHVRKEHQVFGEEARSYVEVLKDESGRKEGVQGALPTTSISFVLALEQVIGVINCLLKNIKLIK